MIGAAAGGTIWWLNRTPAPVILTQPERDAIEERIYEAGEKSFVLTEREVNGLLNHNTGFGESLRIELARDAIHLRFKTTLDEDLPFMGGRTVKARARLLNSAPGSLALDDVTLYGISLPNAWLGDLKGQNLISSLSSELPRGIETFEIAPGELRISLSE